MTDSISNCLTTIEHTNITDYPVYLTKLGLADWIIFAASVVVTILAVIYGELKAKKNLSINKISPHKNNSSSNKNNSAIEYLLMGRQLTLPLFIATLTSTWYGGILGTTQIAFEHGIYNFFTQGFFWYLSYFIFAIFFVKKIRNANSAITLPEMIKNSFGHKSAILGACLIFFKALPISYAISLGVLIQLFTGTSLPTAITIGVSFVIAYSFFGGLRAVVYSDFIQWLLMLTGIISVVVFSFSTFGGIEFLTSHLPASHFTINGNHNLSTAIAWLFIGCATTFINPAFYQRCLAAKDDKTAIYGILISILIWLVIDTCTTLGGMYAKAIIPNANSSKAYLIYSLQLLPDGWRGLFIASLCATILSTLDSFLLIAASTISYDLTSLLQKKNPTEYSPRTLTRTNIFLSMFIVGILTILIAIQFNGNIENVWLTFKGYFTACLLFPLILGYLFPKLITDEQFVISCLVGTAAYTIWEITNPLITLYDLTFTLEAFYIGNIFTLLTISYFVVSKWLKEANVLQVNKALNSLSSINRWQKT